MRARSSMKQLFVSSGVTTYAALLDQIEEAAGNGKAQLIVEELGYSATAFLKHLNFEVTDMNRKTYIRWD